MCGGENENAVGVVGRKEGENKLLQHTSKDQSRAVVEN
jgi:hypothetical protein